MATEAFSMVVRPATRYVRLSIRSMAARGIARLPPYCTPEGRYSALLPACAETSALVVGDQHGSRGVGNAERWPCLAHRGLRRNAPRPEEDRKSAVRGTSVSERVD